MEYLQYARRRTPVEAIEYIGDEAEVEEFIENVTTDGMGGLLIVIDNITYPLKKGMMVVRTVGDTKGYPMPFYDFHTDYELLKGEN